MSDELEARNAALVEALTKLRDEAIAFRSVHADPGYTNLKCLSDRLQDATNALTPDATEAAVAFVERIRAEERERAAAIARRQPFYPDTHTGMRQQWVKERIAEAILAEEPKE